MSPEQAEGKPVDSRSDIFSLGVMLHEMAVGQRPFRGDTNVSVISSILKDTPQPITDINPSAPPELAKVVRRSLAKDPSRRYQTAIDLRNDLEELQEEIGAAATAVTSSRGARQWPAPRWWRSPAAAAAVAIIVLAALIAGFLFWSSQSRAGTDFVADRFTRLTTTGTAQIAAMSGDGRYVVQVKADGPAQSLWVRQTATSSDVQIVPPAAVRYDGLAFSPDGNYVYYSAYALTGGFASLSRIPVLGGMPERVLDDIDSRITFSPDGRQFAFIRGVPGTGRNVVMIANADGGDARALPAPQGRTRLRLDAPAWSPDGRVIIAPAESLEGGVHGLCLAFDVRTGTSREVGGRWRSLSDMAWLPDGRSFIIVGSESSTPWTQQLWQIAYPAGERRRITLDLNNYVGVTLSNDGRSLATVQSEVNSTLWVAPASDSAKGVQITTGSGRGDGLLGLAWAGDGRLVFGSNASGSSQIWIVDADGQHPRQLTSVDGQASNPTTPAAGGFAVYQQFRNEGIHVSRVALDGSDSRQLTNGAGEFTPIVSPDGQWVYFNTFSAGTNQPERIPASGGSPVDIPAPGFVTFSVSPDGTRLLGSLWDAARQRSSLAIVSSAGGTPTLLDLPVLNTASWSPDGRSITYTDFVGGQMTLLQRNLESGATRTLLTLGPDKLFGFAWSPDGQRIVLGRGAISNDVVLIARK
jgi:Tol biopolymer transport system component